MYVTKRELVGLDGNGVSGDFLTPTLIENQPLKHTSAWDPI